MHNIFFNGLFGPRNKLLVDISDAVRRTRSFRKVKTPYIIKEFWWEMFRHQLSPIFFICYNSKLMIKWLSYLFILFVFSVIYFYMKVSKNYSFLHIFYVLRYYVSIHYPSNSTSIIYISSPIIMSPCVFVRFYWIQSTNVCRWVGYQMLKRKMQRLLNLT